MGRYYKQIILSLILLFFISFDVNAESFNSVSTRFVYYYENGQKIDDGFSSETTLYLPRSASSTTSGSVSWRTYQWRYTTSSTLQANKKYRITTDFVFSSLESASDNISVNNFLDPIIGDIGCGTRYNNSSTSNLELHNVEVVRINSVKFRLYYDITPKVSTCNFFSGIYGYGKLDSFNPDYIVNEPTSENGLVTLYISYQLLEDSTETSNSDIIANQDKNTQDIIDNNNSNTQDIIDNNNSNTDKIKDALTDDTPPDTSDLSNASGWLPAGPVDGLITLPINLLQTLVNNLGSSCTPISLPIPFVGGDLVLECPSNLLGKFTGFTAFWNSFGLIAGGWLLYKYFVNLYKWVDNLLSMDEDEQMDDWGGV